MSDGQKRVFTTDGKAIQPVILTDRNNDLVNISNGCINISAGDTPSIDAFGRLRVSNPVTLFDSKNIFDDPDLAASVENQPLFYDNQETSGGGTSTAYDNDTAAQSLSVSATTAGTRIRQTKMYFNYQPGKSQMILMTFTFDSQESGLTQREGIYDNNNGLFFQDNGTNYSFVRRTYTSGAAVDNAVNQTNWNIDPMDGSGASGITLDFTKTQILFIDYEWLGVGRVRMGWVVDGIIYYSHEFLNANNLTTVYMSTPNLPLRSEISNDGTAGAATMTQICSYVISEGGSQDLGVQRYASTSGTHVDCANENTIYAIIGIKLKDNYLAATVKILEAQIAEHTGSKFYEWMLILNPTVADTFTYSDETNSAVQIARGATANTVTNGIYLSGGLGSSAFRGGGEIRGNVADALRLGSTIAGVSDEIVLCVKPIGGTTALDIEGSLTWRELT
jgi:hypothetical protein